MQQKQMGGLQHVATEGWAFQREFGEAPPSREGPRLPKSWDQNPPLPPLRTLLLHAEGRGQRASATWCQMHCVSPARVQQWATSRWNHPTGGLGKMLQRVVWT